MSSNPPSTLCVTTWLIIEADRQGVDHYQPARLLQPLRWRKPRQVHVGFNGGDLFAHDIPDDTIAVVWMTMAEASKHTFIVLTRYPERAQSWLHRTAQSYERWPVANIWLGVPVGDQTEAAACVPVLLECSTALHFVHCTLHAAVDLRRWLVRRCHKHGRPAADCCGDYTTTRRLEWVVLDGGIGPAATPLSPVWAQSLRDQTQAAGVAFQFGGFGAWRPVAMPHAEFNGPRCIMTNDGHIRSATWSDVVALTGDAWAFERAGADASGNLLDGVTWQQMPASAAHVHQPQVGTDVVFDVIHVAHTRGGKR